MSTRRAGWVAAVLSVALFAAGCTADPGSPASSPRLTIAKSPTPSDVGPTADFLDLEELRPLATTPARDDSSYSGATFTILEVRTSKRSTLVVWSAAHPRTLSAGSDFDVRGWRNFPVLSTKSRSYSVLTYEATTGEVECACVDMRAMRAEPNPQGALYPPLPADAASVTLSSPWFRDVTVPVTHE